MTRSSPRNSLKKHDAAASSRASKARRDRTTTQIRKDKRRETVQSKRRRLLSSDDIALSGRDITELVAILSGTNGDATSHADQYEVLQEIRALLAANEHDYEAVERVIESGIVPVLVSLLDAASPLSSSTRAGSDVYKEVLWCLTNIASGQYAHTKLVLPAVPRLLQFVEGANATLAEHAAWVLGNIAADCDEFRQQLIANGAVQPLVARLAHAHVEPKLAQTCAWALSNLARGHATSAKPFVDAGIVPVVTAGLPQGQPHAFSQEIIVEVAWLLSCLTAREEEYLKLWLEHGLVELLLPYFATSDELLLTPILRVMGNICCGASDHHTDAWQLPFVERLLHAEDALFLRKLQEFLQPDLAAAHAHLAAEAAWVLSNLATHDARVVALILPFLPLLAQHFHDAGRFEVRREVAFALANMALTSVTHLETVLQLDVLPGFLHLLSAADVAVVGNSLRLIENVLRVAPNGVSLVESHDGIEALENVQYQSQETHLATWAEAIVNEFYGEQYGINSPPSAGAVGGNVPTFNFELPPQAEPTESVAAAPGGRGRGAHMTVPAWKK